MREWGWLIYPDLPPYQGRNAVARAGQFWYNGGTATFYVRRWHVNEEANHARETLKPAGL